MNKKARSRKFSAKQSARLSAYFAAGVGASMAATSTSDAAIIGINIGPTGFNIAGPNAGLPPDSFANVYEFPFDGAGTLTIVSGYLGFSGLLSFDGYTGFIFSTIGEAGPASPRNFAFNELIGSSANWEFSESSDMLFRYSDDEIAPAFGPGSYLGFRTTQGNYGWLEVLWNGTDEWEILSGAYEDQVGVAILAGDTGGGPEPIPEPGTWAAAALLAGGAAFMRWRRRRDEAQKQAA